MSFYTEVIQRHLLYTSINRVSSLDLLEPSMRAAVQKVVADAAAEGNEVVVFETYRSSQRQASLFHKGATQLLTVGVHHYGLAADLVRLVDGQPNWAVPYAFLGPLAKKHGLVWGGDWTGFKDMDHVQGVEVHQQPQLFAGLWYPTSVAIV